MVGRGRTAPGRCRCCLGRVRVLSILIFPVPNYLTRQTPNNTPVNNGTSLKRWTPARRRDRRAGNRSFVRIGEKKLGRLG
jgi:hypothetical protein